MATNHDVMGTVHMEAECDRAMQLEETRWLSELNAAYGLPSAIVAHAWFDAPDVEWQLSRHVQYPLLRDIRSKPLTASHPGEDVGGLRRTMQDPRWLHGYKLLEQFGLSWDRSAQGLAMWRRGMAALAQVEHVYVKLACVCVPNQPWSMKARRGVILEAIGRFGVDRCMFASNVPPASHPDRLRHHAPRLSSHSGRFLP